MKLFIILIIFISFHIIIPLPSLSQSTLSRMDNLLHDELTTMYAADQKAREGLTAEIMSEDSVRMKKMAQGDYMRTKWLKQIVDSIGWPTKAMVGTDGLMAAFIIVQHSLDYEWQDSVLPFIKKQAMDGDLPKEEYAMLQDRVLMREGKPQMYGTQFTVAHDSQVVYQIEDPQNLDKRRKEMGMLPFYLYQRMINYMYKSKLDTSSVQSKKASNAQSMPDCTGK